MGPIVIISLGLSGAAASFVGSLGQYRQIFVFVSVGLLGIAHYFHGKKKNPKTYESVLLWTMTGLAFVNLLFGSQLISKMLF